MLNGQSDASGHWFDEAPCGRLWVGDYGPIEADHTIVCLHGMRDHGDSFRALVSYFPDSRVLLPDLRGHGRSDWANSYSLIEFVADLRFISEQLSLNSFDLVGHSLGGHIATRYAAYFSEQVRRLVVIDGFGPPRPPAADDPGRVAASGRAEVEHRLTPGHQAKPMASVQEAAHRLARNNPKLDRGEALRLAEYGTQAVDGGVKWAFDVRAQQIWSSFSHRDSEMLLQAIRCPTLVVTGSNGLDYWLGMHPELKDQHALYERELHRRVELVPRGELWVVEGAGHMVHYDQPEALFRQLATWLSEK